MGFLSGWKGLVPCFTSFSSFPNFLLVQFGDSLVQVIASDEGTSRCFFHRFPFHIFHECWANRAAKSQGLHGPASPWCCFGRGKRDGTTNSDSMIKIFHDSPRFFTSRSCQKHGLRQWNMDCTRNPAFFRWFSIKKTSLDGISPCFSMNFPWLSRGPWKPPGWTRRTILPVGRAPWPSRGRNSTATYIYTVYTYVIVMQ